MSATEMRVFSYVIQHDLGFAPNPFHGWCTLACCKPQIRKHAKVGDLVLGMGAVKPKLSGHLSYYMWVEEILTFDQYWADPRFRVKRPNMGASTYLRYGDNIYHREPGGTQFLQEDSFHSEPDGSVSLPNRKRDTGTTDKVLVGRKFSYWGRSGIALPSNLQCFKIRTKGHKCHFTDGEIGALKAWLESLPLGVHDEPAHWQFLERKRRKARKPSFDATTGTSP